MQIKVLDLNNQEHFMFLNYLINYNAKEFLNDEMTGQMMLDNFANKKTPVFIIYSQGKPYGIIYVELASCKNCTLHACCGKDKNFFTNIKIGRDFIKFLFETMKVNKIKVETLVYDTSAEFVARALGFRKEGVLREEIYKNGKPQNMILLSFTKNDYLKKKHILSRQDILKIGSLVNGQR